MTTPTVKLSVTIETAQESVSPKESYLSGHIKTTSNIAGNYHK